MGAAAQRRVADTLTQARQNSGIPTQFAGRDVAGATAGFAREYGITHVVVGRSGKPWHRLWFGPSLLDRLVRARPEATVVVGGTT